MTVRRATKADAGVIAQIHVRTWQEAYKNLMPAAALQALSISDRAQKWREILSDSEHNVYVIEVAERVVGFGGCGESRDDDASTSVGEIYAIYLDHTKMRMGLGKKLLERLEAVLQSAGFDSATLWVLDGNVSARRFYEAHGWFADGKVKTEQKDQMELREVRYRKRL
ncbi:MAG: GNAT family N-acetyltransferase [bacterium]|nr:GNAT family N-acetyltransferase [bacterium]